MNNTVFQSIYGSINPIEIKNRIGFDPTDTSEENLDAISELHYESYSSHYIYFLAAALFSISS